MDDRAPIDLPSLWVARRSEMAIEPGTLTPLLGHHTSIDINQVSRSTHRRGATKPDCLLGFGACIIGFSPTLATERESPLPYRLSIPGQVSELQLRAIEVVATLIPEKGCVVEVGSLFGRSSYAWAKSIPRTATVVCVDPWAGNEGAHQVGAKGGIQYGFEAFAHYTADCPNIVPLRAYSPEGIAWSRPIDCYYEDAVHTDPILSQNISFWSSFLCPTGILCGDDYRPRFPDVRAAAERMAQELGRELIVVDFFWCLLPSEALLPGTALVAEKLRQLNAEAAAERAATPSRICLAPLVPPPRRIAANQPYRLLLRVTNDGGQIWPERAEGELALQVNITGGSSGRTRTLSIPLGKEQLGPDDAIPIDVMIEASDASGVLVELDCVLIGGKERSTFSWRHKIGVDAAGDLFANRGSEVSGLRLDDNWAGPDDAVRWSLGFRSQLVIDPPAEAGNAPNFLNLRLRPFVSNKRRWQRLIIALDGRPVFAGCYSERFGLSLPVPSTSGASVTIELSHPDAHRPSDIDETNLDRRSLGFALESINWSAGRPSPTI